MATETLNACFDYTPGTTLGRTGFAMDEETRLGERIGQLDALMCIVTAGSEDDHGFQGCNDEIQKTVLSLVSDLATEIHELHEKLFLKDLREHSSTKLRLAS